MQYNVFFVSLLRTVFRLASSSCYLPVKVVLIHQSISDEKVLGTVTSHEHYAALDLAQQQAPVTSVVL